MARISVNKLAELLTTPNPARRKRIIQDQKYPSAVIVAKYRQAFDPIEVYLTQGRQNATISAAVAQLRGDNTGTPWTIDDRWNTADALERIPLISALLPESLGEAYVRGTTDAPKLAVAGVDVSIRPDFLISFTKKDKKYTGALKFHFVKNPDNALTRAGSEYVSTLMYRWLEENGPDGTTPSHSHCLSVDIFRESVISAPKSTTRRLAEITAACEEIAARWPQL